MYAEEISKIRSELLERQSNLHSAALDGNAAATTSGPGSTSAVGISTAVGTSTGIGTSTDGQAEYLRTSSSDKEISRTLSARSKPRSSSSSTLRESGVELDATKPRSTLENADRRRGATAKVDSGLRQSVGKNSKKESVSRLPPGGIRSASHIVKPLRGDLQRIS